MKFLHRLWEGVKRTVALIPPSPGCFWPIVIAVACGIGFVVRGVRSLITGEPF